MNKRKLGLLVLCLLPAVLLAGCNFFKSFYELESIPDKLRTALAEEYGTRLPDTAVFVDGFMDVGLRDPHVLLIMRMPQGDFAGMMDENWGEDNVATTIEGIRSEACYFRKGDNGKTSKLFVTPPDDDGMVLVKFDGDAPSTRWIT